MGPLPASMAQAFTPQAFGRLEPEECFFSRLPAADGQFLLIGLLDWVF